MHDRTKLKVLRNILPQQHFLERCSDLLDAIQIPSSVTFTVICSLVLMRLQNCSVEEYFCVTLIQTCIKM